MPWRTDSRTERMFGLLTLVSQTNDARETAHLVTFEDGRKVRVLPDDTSGRMRNARVTTALADLASLVADSGPLVEPEQQERYLIGWFHDYHLSFERVREEQTIEEWLSWWFFESDADQNPTCFLADLEADGWEIRRRA